MNSKSAKLKRNNSKKTRSKKSYRRRKHIMKQRIMKGGYKLNDKDKEVIEQIMSDKRKYMETHVTLPDRDQESAESVADDLKDVAVDKLVDDILLRNNKEQIKRSILQYIVDMEDNE